MLIKHDSLPHLNFTEETTPRIVLPYIHSSFYCDEHSYHKTDHICLFLASNPSTQLGWQNFTVKPTTNFHRHKTTNVYSLCIKARGTLCPLWRRHGSGTLEEYANQPLQQFACLLIALLSRVCVCMREEFLKSCRQAGWSCQALDILRHCPARTGPTRPTLMSVRGRVSIELSRTHFLLTFLLCGFKTGWWGSEVGKVTFRALSDVKSSTISLFEFRISITNLHHLSC